MSRRINVELSELEYENLRFTLGDFRRITRDSYHKFVKTGYEYSVDVTNKEKYDVACSLYKKLVEDPE
jgi:hypothetical protein